MSRSEKKRGSLARCYDAISTNKARKLALSSGSNSSTVAGVKSKLQAAGFAEKKGEFSESTLTKAESPKGDAFDTKQPTPADQSKSSDGASVLESSTESTATNSAQGTSYDSDVSTEPDKKNIDHMAKCLTDPQLMWVSFFSGIVTDDASDAVGENVDEKELEFTHIEEEKQAMVRGVHRFETVCNLPLKIILTPLKRGKGLADTFASLLEMEFGPLHAALQVGDVILEWNDSHLVAPYKCNFEDQVFEVDMQSYSEWVEYTSQNSLKMKKAAEQLDFTEQIELIYTVSSKKKELIDALIKLIIRYNKHYYYNLFNRNCQHFVIDALKALQVKNPTGFTGGLRDYFVQLVKGRTPSIPGQFKTHKELDTYVMTLKGEDGTTNIPQHDLEFILTLYFRFHLKSKDKSRKDHKALEEWKCQEAGCQMKELEQLIQMESLKIHGFRHRD